MFVDDKSLPIRSRRVTAGQTSKYKENYVVISKSCERVSSKNRSKQCISGPEIISAGTMPAEAAHQSICGPAAHQPIGGPAVPPIQQCDIDLEAVAAEAAHQSICDPAVPPIQQCDVDLEAMAAEAAHQPICGPAVPPIKQCDMDLENASASYAFAADSHHEQDLSTALLQLLLLLLVCVSFTIIGQPRNSVLIRRV